MKRTLMIMLVCGLVLTAVACAGSGASTPAPVGEAANGVTETTGTTVPAGGVETPGSSVKVPFDPALLGKWESVGERPERDLLYLGSLIEFGTNQPDPGHPVGVMRSGTSTSGDWLFESKFTAQDGKMTISMLPPTVGINRGIDRLNVLEATYSIQGDTLTIVPSDRTPLATATYQRVEQ